jgi:FKBP-type peptidyl-prolyl cis-trans isomerase SlyD
MKIEKDKVVKFFYSLKNSDGEELENNFHADPTAYLHGYNNIFPALEHALLGLEPRDEKTVNLKAEDAYGMRREEARQRVPLKHILGEVKHLKLGDFIKVNTANGPIDGSVIKTGKFMVDVDFNHPLAGAALCFEVKIQSVRDAEVEEIENNRKQPRK